MTKKRIKNAPRIPAFPDFPNLPKVNWEEIFDPRRKARPANDVAWFAALIPDYTFLQAIIITQLILKEVKAGLDGVNHKTGNAAALTEWRGLLLPAVYARLQQPGADWNVEGPNVLKVARDMGTIAGLLAGSNSEAGVNQLKGAFAASKAHTTCAGASGGVGGGAWCSFNWI